jgi:hypothetical protein
VALGSSSSKRILSTKPDRKTLDDALEYVGKGWMPISPEVLALIKAKLANGGYDQNPDGFTEDLRKDFSLYSWFLSQLSQLKLSIPSESAFDIDQIVREIEVDQLVGIFGKADDSYLHKRDNSIKSQNLALKQSLTAVATAQVLADKKGIDANLAHICCGVRQLGINLVAWNYPRIFARAVEHCQKNDSSLDRELLKILGYSPLQLGSELALKWDASGSLKSMVFQDFSNISRLPENLLSQIGASPSELVGCVTLAEEVSKLAVPEIYPAVAGLMPKVISEVEAALGAGGFEQLREDLEKSSQEYSGEAEKIVLDIDPEIISHIAQNRLADQLVESNLWVLKCPSVYKEKFRNLYLNINKHKVSATAINILVSEVIPSLGFTKGCVYLVEEKHNKLNPVLRIGDSPISRYRQLDCSATEKSSHPVIVALGYNSPFIQENVPVNGEFVSHVTGTFTGQNKTGVLYLEMSDTLTRSADRIEPLLFFKAVRQALIDCLNLK